MSKVFAVLGAGMQGTALAYDLAKHASPERVILADVCGDQAAAAAERVNRLAESDVCTSAQVDALDEAEMVVFLKEVDVLASCVPYWMHPQIAAAAIAAKTSMVDLGGNTEITLKTLAMNAAAQESQVTLVPDCGLAPGLVNNLGCYCIEQLDEVESVKLYCGVLPQHPEPPFNYKLTFNVEGLVTEYDYEAVVLRDGKIEKVDTLDELESLHIEELGNMEAFTTSGGTSTAPYTFEGKVKNYEYKTIRFPGHCERMRIFKDFGFWSHERLEIGDCEVKPVELFYKVFGDKLAQYEDLDMCAVRAVGLGTKDGQPKRIQIDIFDREDEATGFTSMERLTGFSAAIYAEAIAAGEMPTGALRYETAMSGGRFVEQIQRRGIQLKFN
ncbi:MAG: saccharopine dehydrogenase NADP-binding domain-containing protein [Fimbriimonadaceae bacterium]|nr:saccharopine dehydrogenase NADP-binding domain-containing protein [Fimbriimonadaceae bacterium]QOJ11147.1 MAG: saccharopine dehydrogenase NADP-binding domain-containing protein [Chthonomonadaceae bacterium]